MMDSGCRSWCRKSISDEIRGSKIASCITSVRRYFLCVSFGSVIINRAMSKGIRLGCFFHKIG